MPATSVVTGLSSAMKVFGEHNLSFKQGVSEAVTELTQLGNTAVGNELASKLFGGRKWTEVMAMLQPLKDTLDAAPGQFDGIAGSTQNLINRTETLGNRMEAGQAQDLRNAAPARGGSGKDS